MTARRSGQAVAALSACRLLSVRDAWVARSDPSIVRLTSTSVCSMVTAAPLRCLHAGYGHRLSVLHEQHGVVYKPELRRSQVGGGVLPSWRDTASRNVPAPSCGRRRSL